MSLPACQQRVLDGIAQILQATEPHLAAMYAIFTRLAGDEPAPGLERLPDRRARLLAGLPGWPGHGAAARPRLSSSGLGVASSPAAQPRHVPSWLRVVAVSHLALIVVLCAVLIGISAHSGPGCRPTEAARARSTAVARAGGCQPVTNALTGTVSK
jgi:hypothetical protein